MNKTLFSFELLRMRRSLAIKSLLIFALFAGFYSIWSGVAWQSANNATLIQYEEYFKERSNAWRADLVAIENGETESSPYSARPMDIVFPAVHETGSMSHLAIGMAEISPKRLLISPRRNGMTMIEPYEFDNPMTLLFGRMDFLFFITIIAPLLLIALNFDVIASDRSRGLYKMLLSNPLTENSVIMTRMLARSSLLFAITLAALISGLVIAENASINDVVSWLLLVGVYFVFWFGLIFLLVSRSLKGVSALSKLVCLWLFFALIIPAASNSVATYLFPQPSKLELLSDARFATSEATKRTAELTQTFLEDHPELTIGDSQVPGYYRALFLSNSVVEKNTQPIVRAFAESVTDRENMLNILQYLSPTIILQRRLIAIAQTDSRNHALFLQTAAQHLTEVSGAIELSVLSSNRITVSEFDQIPTFEEVWMATEKPHISIIGPVVFILFFGLILLSSSRSRLVSEEGV